MNMNWKDWYVMVHMGTVLFASTYFVFLHPEHFATWTMFVGAVGAIFHWLTREKAVASSTP